jgi:hypothetical protein
MIPLNYTAGSRKPIAIPIAYLAGEDRAKYVQHVAALLACLNRARSSRFVADSPLEEGGFEPSVPLPKSPHLRPRE